jgi:hypothetical protein
MTFVAVAPRFKITGFDGRRRNVADAFEVLELRDALTRVYSTDAHLVTYVVPGATRQPRINKPGLPYFDGFPKTGVFFCDLDNPAHGEWTPELYEAALARYRSIEILQTAGIYHTAHGARVVQPIVRPVPVEQAEPFIARWLSELRQAGLDPDNSCKDWTRLFRLPNVLRDGKDFRSPFIRLDRMRPVALEPLWEPPPARSSITPLTRPQPLQRIDWRQDVPGEWRDRVQPIADAIRAVQTTWHTLFLALSGALLRRGVPPDQLPAIVRAISVATGTDTRTDDRELGARSTVETYLSGLPCTGFGTLAREWPTVAEAVDAVLSDSTAEPALASTDEHSPPPLAESQAAMREAIRDAPDGLTLIAAECGLGKTAAALRVAVERASKQHTSPDAEGTRAPLNSKTAISVDKHELALQIVADLADHGVLAQRFFGPLSLKHPDGTPVCKLHQVARHLVSGGQPMQWELCQGRDIDPCPHRDTCPAKDGVEGPEDARVTIGPHQLIGALDREAGTTGLLVIDEPPDLLDLTPLRTKDLEDTLEILHVFDAVFSSALAPALEALLAWTEHIGPIGECVPIQEAISQATEAIEPATLERARITCQFTGDAVEYATAAQPDERTGKAPPIRFIHLKMARDNVAYARRLGRASGVLHTLFHAVTSGAPAAVVLEKDRKDRAHLIIITVRQQLAQALRREGAVVAMDANIAVNAPIFAKAVGYTPPLHQFTGTDGAPIRRLHIRRKSAVRKHWIPRGKLKLATGLVQSVKDILDFAKGTESLGIITMRTIELALRAALEPDNSQLDDQWSDARQDPKVLSEARDQLGPILRAYPGTILFGHYLAVRGLNNMSDVECLATLGDPWPNLNRVRHEVMFLGLEDSWESRLLELCKAELEQAHGRLRAVHRKAPAMALHIGSVRPTGYGWTTGSVEVRQVKTGRPANESSMTIDELRRIVDAAGGSRALARKLGCDHKTISRYLNGRQPSATIAKELRNVSTLDQVGPKRIEE